MIKRRGYRRTFGFAKMKGILEIFVYKIYNLIYMGG